MASKLMKDGTRKCLECGRAYRFSSYDGKHHETPTSERKNADKDHCDYCQPN